jgi:hypothetical protein
LESRRVYFRGSNIFFVGDIVWQALSIVKQRGLIISNGVY